MRISKKTARRDTIVFFFEIRWHGTDAKLHRLYFSMGVGLALARAYPCQDAPKIGRAYPAWCNMFPIVFRHKFVVCSRRDCARSCQTRSNCVCDCARESERRSDPPVDQSIQLRPACSLNICVASMLDEHTFSPFPLHSRILICFSSMRNVAQRLILL